MLAYAGGEPGHTSIFVRQVSGGEAIRLARGLAPQWSPDGSKLVYVDSAGIAMVPALGGSPQRLIRRSEKEGFPISPTWSHDGKSLAYSAVLTGGADAIWIANADGSEPRKIMARFAHSLSWSSDDSRLAFVGENLEHVYGTDQFGNIAPSTLWIVGRDGKGAASLTDSIHHSVSPVWTSEGDGILYVSNIGGGRDLYYQRVRRNKRRCTAATFDYRSKDSRDCRWRRRPHRLFGVEHERWHLVVAISSIGNSLCFFPHVRSARPPSASRRVTLSPDKQWLAFDSDRSGNMDIYKMRIDGTGLQQLTRNPADDFYPSWSPDGRQIAFHSWRSGNRDSYVMSADGSAERMIAGGPAHEYAGAWSPDGSQIAFWSDRSGRDEIYIVPASGGDARRLTSEGASVSLWSPDGNFIAYKGGDDALRLISPRGGQSKILVSRGTFGRVVSVGGWSADSRKIYFRVLAPDGSLNIAQVSVDGSNPSLLVRFDDRERRGYRSDFTTDGKTIYFTVGKHEADIWVMDLKKK